MRAVYPDFVLLRTALKDSPQGPLTANRQPLPTANRQPLPTANRQPLPTANRQPLTANRCQPPTANRQDPSRNPKAPRTLLSLYGSPPPPRAALLVPCSALHRNPPDVVLEAGKNSSKYFKRVPKEEPSGHPPAADAAAPGEGPGFEEPEKKEAADHNTVCGALAGARAFSFNNMLSLGSNRISPNKEKAKRKKPKEVCVRPTGRPRNGALSSGLTSQQQSLDPATRTVTNGRSLETRQSSSI